jgi:serine/threonine protein kinase
LERQVAVKLIRPELTVSTDAALRFKQEAKAAAGFTHPNVVTIHDYGVAENQRAYIVMELLRGSTLRQALSQNGRFSAQHALEIFNNVCTAVDAAHRRRLLHRDLKPENIFLTDIEGVETAKILDFGVVKPIAAVDSTTMSIGQTDPGMLVGTLKYMAPEQLRGEKPTESWDIWSLSVVAYEMLAGNHPFAGSTALDIRNAVLTGQMTMLKIYLPEAPTKWQEFFDKAFSPRVELRPNTALGLFYDFKQNIQ